MNTIIGIAVGFALCLVIIYWGPPSAIPLTKDKIVSLATAEKKWPDTAPPDKTDKFWEFNNNLNVNGTPYKKEEVAPGKWQWAVDKESQRRSWQYEREKSELYMALRTRVVSDAEFDRAKSLGLSLVTQPMVSYRESDKQNELNEAFLQQFKLRQIANH